MAQYAGHLTEPPRDAYGRPIPSAAFQLYVLGTKTAPTRYTDRTKAVTVPGDPTSDSRGNVDVWVEPGIYEYWYNGAFIQTFTVDEDNGEDDYALTQAVNLINATLATSYYTKTQVDSAIASGGGPVVGAELQANKNLANGYAGLDGSGLVAYAQLPATVERTTNKNQNDGYAGLNSSGKIAPAQLDVGALGGTHGLIKTTTYTASPGDFILADTTGGTFAVTLPTPSGDNAPITVKWDAGSAAPSVSGPIEGSTQTLTIDTAEVALTFVAVGGYWQRAQTYVPLSIVARLDKDNDFGNHQISNYKDKVFTVSTPTYTAGTDGWGIRLRWSNNGGNLQLPNNASIGDWIIIHQAAATQVVFQALSGASFSEPDGYSKTGKQTAAAIVTCLRNDTGTAAVYVVGGYTGA